jgi:CLASP N terminal.
MHQEHGLQFRAYVPNLMELLEDADSGVREVAKSTVIELFRFVFGTRFSISKRYSLLEKTGTRPMLRSPILSGN